MMKNIAKFTLWGVVMCCSFCAGLFPSQAFSAADTVQHREIKYILSDSTLIRYEIGQVMQVKKRPLGWKFIPFDDFKTTEKTGYLLQTAPFAISNEDDSLYFRRFMGFDDGEIYPPIDLRAYPEAVGKMLVHDRSLKYQKKQIVPKASAFGLNSRLLYIVELWDVSADKLLFSLDTVVCFVNSRGEMRYRGGKKDLQFVHVPTFTIPKDEEYRLRVKVVPLYAEMTTSSMYVSNADHQMPLSPYTTTIAAHLITVNGIDVDSMMVINRKAREAKQVADRKIRIDAVIAQPSAHTVQVIIHNPAEERVGRIFVIDAATMKPLTTLTRTLQGGDNTIAADLSPILTRSTSKQYPLVVVIYDGEGVDSKSILFRF